ncbi:MAG: CoA transferase [Deltaproteobacteria bacterium]|nr:CoA transferase [Deltaproteobacteria bacterium]
MHGLKDIRVIDFSTAIAGHYATKLLADAGADVIKVEALAGDPMRSWSASGGEFEGDSPFFQFLNGSKRSVVGEPADDAVQDLIGDSDLVVEDWTAGALDVPALRKRMPHLVVLSISPFGRTGPYANRPATEFTIQAESGSIAGRGLASDRPFMAGGRTTEWIGGTYAAVAALAALQHAQRTGIGEYVDFSLLEVMNLASTVFVDLMIALMGVTELHGPGRSIEIPSIEPTLDGWVGFNTNTRQQFNDFLLLIERTDLLEDEALASVGGRQARMDEWNAIVRTWTTKHTTAEIVERASLLRIPVAPVGNGRSVLEHEQFVARRVFEESPHGGFLQPRPPYRMNGARVGELGRAPLLGEHSGAIEPRTPRPTRPTTTRASGNALPLEGIRILDATAWWAGPSATQMLATLGADVIHLESIQRPDGGRLAAGALVKRDAWWEWSGLFIGTNSNKRSLTLDLGNPRGLELGRRLIGHCDVVVENFSPRVFEGFGLDWPAIHALSPRCLFVRMPAFGLDGPWRDNVGFAQTMEQMTGLAWLTGHPHDQPRIQRGPSDPLAGMHAAFSICVGLAERERTGLGLAIECTMVEGALNAAAEQVIEYTAFGKLLEREGNRSASAAPQGLYACEGSENWLALSIETETQWQALVDVLGRPGWALEPKLSTLAGRRAAHDAIDAELERWAAKCDLRTIVDELIAAGVPAARVYDGRRGSEHPQMEARGFFEAVEHPTVGKQPIPTQPFRYASRRRWVRMPSPTLGQHNHEILSELLGLGEPEIAELEAEEIIGTWPKGL